LNGLPDLYGRQQLVGNRPLIKLRGLQGTLLSAETRRVLATSPDAALRPGDVVAACSTDTTNVAARSPRQTTARLTEITGRIVPPPDGDDVTDDD
jgi:hypothetical protein